MELQAAQMISPLRGASGTAVTDFSSLANLKGKAAQDNPDALKEVAQHFEALFVQMMTKAMRDATEDGGLFGSDEMKFHQSMFDQQISLHLSQSGGVGLAQIIERQLAGPQASEGKELQPLAQTWSKSWQKKRAALGAAANEPAQRPAVEHFEPQTPQQFVQALWPHAQRAGDKLGVEAEVLVAQAALESGWGKYTIRDTDGRNSLNLFGIKADNQWQGERATKVTLEYRDGIASKERASFRAYQSLEQLFDDYVEFLQKPRYQQARAATNGEEFVQALQDNGYATDPKYAQKISALMQRDSFRSQIGELKGVELKTAQIKSAAVGR
ncbi:flagellar assembly peptidoglycan hydrolase FlgJ [Porticoccus sp. W117]|uniref:flagellar assembly peptidoglycan hydrolase FlgJ n=1 Tax=Porticoccus sp. W117 TaxID=3054777 RepID=UPI002593B87E|nr:flagellar assembly peptidoglycan hydrolase FlgJ [Porticoccus sp. W117]MDM3871017.1 flagellar assembly peptidoglycan hydrolase FlgJ [Porticoccus sp. W117]